MNVGIPQLIPEATAYCNTLAVPFSDLDVAGPRISGVLESHRSISSADKSHLFDPGVLNRGIGSGIRRKFRIMAGAVTLRQGGCERDRIAAHFRDFLDLILWSILPREPAS